MQDKVKERKFKAVNCTKKKERNLTEPNGSQKKRAKTETRTDLNKQK